MKEITKKFLDGNLAGSTTKSVTAHGFEKNKIYTDCVTGNKYEIIEIKDVNFGVWVK